MSTGFPQPLTGDDLPRPAGIPTFFRLPHHQGPQGLDISVVGVPLDTGTSYRPGARFAPRQIRCDSARIDKCNPATGACPFKSLKVADVGDVPCTLHNLPEACRQIRDHFRMLTQAGCKTLAVGGDHTITYPILQAIKEKYGPVGLVHIDAHRDTADTMFGQKICHGTPFRRAVEEGLLDCHKVYQIGIRGSTSDLNEHLWGEAQGFRTVPATDCWHKSLTPLMTEVREYMGSGPVYLSFDIDAIDPTFAPGTGTTEIGGLTSIQALEIIRGMRGLNLIGADLVEVSPACDYASLTTTLAANLLFEILCVFPGVQYGQ